MCLPPVLCVLAPGLNETFLLAYMNSSLVEPCEGEDEQESRVRDGKRSHVEAGGTALEVGEEESDEGENVSHQTQIDDHRHIHGVEKAQHLHGRRHADYRRDAARLLRSG